MKSPPIGTEIARPIVPARDFELSKRFYLEIGFHLLHDGDVAIFGIGDSSFVLQNYYNKDWAANFMMQLMVDDVDVWWEYLNHKDLPAHFPAVSLRPPEVQPWGLKIAYLVDPSGVLWHVAERRDGVSHDTWVAMAERYPSLDHAVACTSPPTLGVTDVRLCAE